VPVLFLELSESEVNPCSYIPTYIPLSNGNVYDTTKEMFKAQAEYMLVSPPSCGDLQQMAIVEAELGTDSVFKGLSKETILQTVKDRVDTLGPVVRNVFVTGDKFSTKKSYLFQDAAMVFNEFDQIGVSSMPSNAKNYIGAFVNNGKFVPSLSERPVDLNWYSIRFLSDYTAQAVAKACTKENYINLMRNKIFDYFIAEVILTYGLMVQKPADIIDPNWNYENWKFYKNPIAKQMTNNTEVEQITYITRKDKIDRPDIPPCTRQIIFDTKYLCKNVAKLQERVLYRSGVYDGALFDHLLVVDHTVYVFQSSQISAKSHSLDYSTIKNVMDNLQFDQNPDYNMVYVYCRDNHSKEQTGCKITNENKKPLNEAMVAVIDKSFEIKIARVCYYPKLDQIEI
jgi:hypothetical protein